MIRVSTSTRKGFTLVEIMIVVAIIALLASIAVPNFLRSRKRAQATQVLEDLRLIDSAWDLHRIEFPKDAMSWARIQKYLKNGTRLYNSDNKDIFGNEFQGDATKPDGVPQVHQDTFEALSDVAPADFWTPFYAAEPTSNG